jgi:hypothetical protein
MNSKHHPPFGRVGAAGEGAVPFRQLTQSRPSHSHWLPSHPDSLPSPENSSLKATFADQTLAEFLGEGLGVRVSRFPSRWLAAESKFAAFVHSNIGRVADSDCPSPPAPHPREFGQRLILKRRLRIRIHGERGAS